MHVITLGEHFEGFIASQIQSGRYGSASEVIRSALRLLENQETKLNSLRQLLVEGEQSGDADYDLDSFIDELDSENSRALQGRRACSELLGGVVTNR